LSSGTFWPEKNLDLVDNGKAGIVLLKHRLSMIVGEPVNRKPRLSTIQSKTSFSTIFTFEIVQVIQALLDF
jgi:hypothetical protein